MARRTGPPEAGPPLVGRFEELRTVAELLDAGRDHGAAILMHGEAGIGKTALLAAATAAAHARGYQVLSASGLESEANLPYAGLHQLLRPLLDRASRLAGPQRSALLGAFGMAEVSSAEPFLIGLATLNLLADAATGAPLLLLVDDAHWLDEPTREVLAFVARRLESDPIVLLAAVRDGDRRMRDDVAMVELVVEALDGIEAAALLDARAPDLDAGARDRILVEAAGNPLALLELPLAVRAALGKDGALPAVLPLTTRLERAFTSRVRRLPQPTRTLVLVAAIDDGDDLTEILAAGTALVGDALDVHALDPAVTAGLVTVGDGRLRFRHPLVRSAVAQAGERARRAAHAALAEVLVDQPDRRAWHRAGAIAGQDEDVAAEVEAAAVRARQRGGIDKAIATEEQAARLTPDLRRRALRLLAAAEMAFESGAPKAVDRLLDQAQQLGLDAIEARRATWIREMFDDGTPGDPDRVRSLVETAEAARQAGDTDLSVSLLFGAALRCWWADPGEVARSQVVAAVERLDLDASDPRVLAVIAVAEPIQQAARVMDRLAGLRADEIADPDALRLLGGAAHAVGDFERAATFHGAAADGLRNQGRLALLVESLGLRTHTALELGDWETAIIAADECRRLADETRQGLWLCGAWTAQAEVLGLRGDLERAEALVAQAERIALPRRLNYVLSGLESVRGKALLTAGQHATAYQRLRRVFDPGDIAHHPRGLFRAIGAFAEAAVHSGHRDDARTLLVPVEHSAAISPAPKLHIGLAYARAVLADEADAEPLYLAGLGLATERWPFERARLQLAYGAWLRRRRRARESRAPLRAAGDTFNAMGLEPWAERARQELRASGETRAARGNASWTDLSPQELQIARMAADGLSNAEIGQRLFLSHRTVGSHLYRVFPKLGITSRGQLRDVLTVG
jgi:DNA-binding CsgD family transcriptional regulator